MLPTKEPVISRSIAEAETVVIKCPPRKTSQSIEEGE
jgi:hypothetical protein